MTNARYQLLFVLVLGFAGSIGVRASEAPGSNQVHDRFTPDLSRLVPILDERFTNGLDRYDGRRGVWSTLPRRRVLVTNASETVFTDRDVLGSDPELALPDVHVVTDAGLSLRTLPIPNPLLGSVREYMRRSGQGSRSEAIRYATGQITTADTWAQTYGYFEIRARVPRGTGRWPAFWLTFAGQGWPPEIDVMEAFGEGLDRPTDRDGVFNAAVYYDALDESGEAVHEVPLEDPYVTDGAGRVPNTRERGKRTVYNFQNKIDTGKLGADIYDGIWTYAALWTPDAVIFYFGKTREDLREIYRTPTPDDLHVPMFLIANDQFTTQGGWWSPRDAERGRIAVPSNDFLVESITVMALPPEREVEMKADEAVFLDGGGRLRDTPGDDDIVLGEGFDIVALSGGSDVLHIRRGHENKIVAGFDPDDRLILDGYPFEDAADAMSRLTQVGDDVWLPSGADPFWPQTIIFRDTSVESFAPLQIDIRWPVGRDIWAADATRSNRPEPTEEGAEEVRAQPEGSWLSDRGRSLAMFGGPGTDRYIQLHAESRISEPADGGLDTLHARVSARMPDHVERGVADAEGITLVGTSGHDRLETLADGVSLDGGAGNDLHVLQPGLRDVRIVIRRDPGEDRVRGLESGAEHQIEIAPDLQSERQDWQVEEVAGGWRVTFDGSQSLIVEGVDRDLLDALLSEAEKGQE